MILNYFIINCDKTTKTKTQQQQLKKQQQKQPVYKTLPVVRNLVGA